MNLKTIMLYFKNQYLHLLLGILFLSLPLYFLIKYLPKIPHTQYLFICILIFLRLIVFNDKERMSKLRKKVTKELTREFKRVPSDQYIYNRIQFYLTSRDITLFFHLLIIIMISILFGRF